MFIIESDFEYKGYRCVTIFHDGGFRCGYVGLPKGHPLYKMDYTGYLDIPKSEIENKEVGNRGIIPLIFGAMDDNENVRADLYFNVHGSLTYSGGNGKYPVESDLWWLGFDCGHFGDGKDLDKIEELWGDEDYIQRSLEIEREYYIDDPVRTLGYVQQECMNLVDQIEKYIGGN